MNFIKPLIFVLVATSALAAATPEAEKIDYVAKQWSYTGECINLILKDDLTNAAICASEKAYDLGDSGAVHLQALIELLRGDMDAALKLVNKAIALDGKQHLHYSLRARIHMHQMKDAGGFSKFMLVKKVYADYEKALELDPNVLEYRAFLVNYKLKAPAIGGGDPDDALALAEEGVALGVPGASLLRARAYVKKKQPDKAIGDLNVAMEEGEFDAAAFVAGGYWALEAGKQNLARSYFAYLIEKDPENPNSYDCMGDYYLAQEDKSKARELFATALAKNPDFKPSKEKYDRLQNGT